MVEEGRGKVPGAPLGRAALYAAAGITPPRREGALWNADGGAGEGAGLFALSGRKERSQPEKGPARPERPSPRSGPPLSEGVVGPGGPASFGRSVAVSGRCGRPAAGLQGASAEAGGVAGRLSGVEAQPAGEETRASVSGRCTVCFGICEPGLDALGRQGAETSFRCWAMQLKVLETGSPKSRCQQGCTPSRGSTGESAPCFFRFLVSAGIPRIPWLEATSLQYLPPSSQCPLLSSCHLVRYPLEKPTQQGTERGLWPTAKN
nr:collagen alpha-1(VII) chain-like [Equus asinus]